METIKVDSGSTPRQPRPEEQKTSSPFEMVKHTDNSVIDTCYPSLNYICFINIYFTFLVFFCFIYFWLHTNHRSNSSGPCRKHGGLATEPLGRPLTFLVSSMTKYLYLPLPHPQVPKSCHSPKVGMSHSHVCPFYYIGIRSAWTQYPLNNFS